MNPTAVFEYARTPPPSSLQLLGRVAGHAWQQTRTEGLADGVRALWGAGRMLGERSVLAELFAIPAFAQLMAAQPQADALFFISHRHFLSREFDTAARVASVLAHFNFEQAHFTPALLQALHGDGLRLWGQAAGCEIRLRANATARHEGPLSLVLRRGGQTVHELSFACIDAQQLGAEMGSGPVLFATRNQSLPPDAPEAAGFRADFPQNSPACFALAALQGVAAALGQQRIVGVQGDRQIAFEPCHEASFKRAYDDLWRGLGGRPVGGHGLEMAMPAALAPVEQLQAKHRARAHQRREHWRQIAEVAEAALSPYLKR
ncbi:DUF535 family protein [Roseateles sp.]|uniref:DUF535 family protein n=1 Tax=Roseateles sp. TaxID=1971397 RepID=UPI0032653425